MFLKLYYGNGGGVKTRCWIGLGWKFLTALFRYFPTVSHDTHALYDAPLLLEKKAEDESVAICSIKGLDSTPKNG
jgi:hypothetical protein